MNMYKVYIQDEFWQDIYSDRLIRMAQILFILYNRIQYNRNKCKIE